MGTKSRQKIIDQNQTSSTISEQKGRWGWLLRKVFFVVFFFLKYRVNMCKLRLLSCNNKIFLHLDFAKLEIRILEKDIKKLFPCAPCSGLCAVTVWVSIRLFSV